MDTSTNTIKDGSGRRLAKAPVLAAEGPHAEAAPRAGRIPRPSKATAQDSPVIAKRRQREKKTISQMVAIYCAGNHEQAVRTETAYCGEAVCPRCKAVDDYSVMRTERCRQMAVKTSCDECPYHCYRPEEREQIKQVMRYAGPRMMTKHPVAALRHLMGK